MKLTEVLAFEFGVGHKVRQPSPKPVKEAAAPLRADQKAQYVENYVGAFEPDGRVGPNVLPWDTTADFNNAMKTVQKVPRAFFMNKVNVPNHVWDKLRDHYVSFLKTEDGVYIIHDDKSDDHYFFV